MARPKREDMFAEVIIEELEPLSHALPITVSKAGLTKHIVPNEIELRRLVIGRAKSRVRSEIKDLASKAKQGNAPRQQTVDAALRLKKPLDALVEVLNSIPADNVFSKRACAGNLPAILSDLQGLCAYMERHVPHGNTDVTKADCASAAWRLIWGLSKNKPSTARLEAIAVLLHEFVTGERDADMKRACATCVRRMRSQERELERGRERRSASP
jgi:hypothetical protein